MPDMDQGLKHLVQSHPQDLVSLVLPGAEYLNTLSPEVTMARQFTLDALLRVRVRWWSPSCRCSQSCCG